jgi:hypothetical protein
MVFALISNPGGSELLNRRVRRGHRERERIERGIISIKSGFDIIFLAFLVTQPNFS